MRTLGWIFICLGALGGSLLVAGGSGGGPMAVLLLPAIVGIVVGWGLLTRRLWAYRLATGLALAGAAASVAWMLRGVAIAALALVISSGILFYLWSPSGRTGRTSARRRSTDRP